MCRCSDNKTSHNYSHIFNFTLGFYGTIENEISKEILTIDDGTCIVKKRNFFIAFGGFLRRNQIVTISEKGFKEFSHIIYDVFLTRKRYSDCPTQKSSKI